MNMQPAELEHSTGRTVEGLADRDAFEAGAEYVDVQFDLTSRPTQLHRSKVSIPGTPAPIPAPRDWNDESVAIVATYASRTQGGHALHSEPVDQGGYSPYFRSSSQRNVIEVFA